MSIPLRQQFKVASYILNKRFRGEKRYPLTLMLEPLFQCNLACPGCGKIDYDMFRHRYALGARRLTVPAPYLSAW